METVEVESWDLSISITPRKWPAVYGVTNTKKIYTSPEWFGVCQMRLININNFISQSLLWHITIMTIVWLQKDDGPTAVLPTGLSGISWGYAHPIKTVVECMNRIVLSDELLHMVIILRGIINFIKKPYCFMFWCHNACFMFILFLY